MAKHKNFKNTYRYNNIYNGLGVLLDEMQRYPFGFKKVYHGTLRDLTDTLMNFFIYKAEREDTGFLIGEILFEKRKLQIHVFLEHDINITRYGSDYVKNLFVYIEYPTFSYQCSTRHEIVPLLSKAAADEDYISIIKKYSPNSNFLKDCYTPDSVNLELNPEEIDYFFTSETVRDDFEIFNIMQKNTPESVIEALKMFKVPEHLIIRYKVLNSYTVEPSSISNMDMLRLL